MFVRARIVRQMLATCLFVTCTLGLLDLHHMYNNAYSSYEEFKETVREDRRNITPSSCEQCALQKKLATKAEVIEGTTAPSRFEAILNYFSGQHFSTRHSCLGVNCEYNTRRQRHVSCSSVIEGDPSAVVAAKRYMQFHPYTPLSDAQLKEMTSDCTYYKKVGSYGRTKVTTEEREFPIAFTILVHVDSSQVERLLRTIYRPHNYYCIHVDGKATAEFRQAIQGLADCLQNVFVTTKTVSVVYASFSRLQAELNCIEDLLARSRDWRYLINLTGQEFPLKTNRELVHILRAYNGANDIEGVSRSFSNPIVNLRYTHKFLFAERKPPKAVAPKSSPPGNIYIVKGSAYGTFSRAFLEWALKDKLVLEFLEWIKDTYSPDEAFWATINHRLRNPWFRSPGGYDFAPERKPWLTKFAAWPPRDPCKGRIRRSVCIFGLGDVARLTSRKELFANKFYATFEYLTLDCMEEWIHNKTMSNLPFADFQYYRELPFVLR